MGDFNCCWLFEGNKEKVEPTIEEEDLYLANDCGPTHFREGKIPTLLDWILVRDPKRVDFVGKMSFNIDHDHQMIFGAYKMQAEMIVKSEE